MTKLAAAIARAKEFRLHPLGFFYLLDSLDERSARRIHVWTDEGTDRPENDRHQHSFDIHSMIVAGRMRSELFRFVETPDGEQDEFTVSYKDGRSILSPTGRKGNLELISTFESSAGNSYFLQAGVIHRVAVMDRPCVTVLSTVECGIPIYSYGSDAAEPPFERRHVNEAEAAEIVRTLQTAGG